MKNIECICIEKIGQTGKLLKLQLVDLNIYVPPYTVQVSTLHLTRGHIVGSLTRVVAVRGGLYSFQEFVFVSDFKYIYQILSWGLIIIIWSWILIQTGLIILTS